MKNFSGYTYLVMLLSVLLLVPVRVFAISSANYSLQGGVVSGGGNVKATSSEGYVLGGIIGLPVHYPKTSIDTEQYDVKPVTLATMGTSPPTVVTLGEGAVTSTEQMTISGMVDLSAPPKSLTINGMAVTWDSSGFYSTVVKLTSGANAIQVDSVDQNDIASGVSRKVTLNSQAPRVQFVSPRSNSEMFTTQVVTLSGTVDSDATLVLKLNGVERAVTSSAGTFSATLSGLASGDNSVVVTATRDGLSGSAVLRLVGLTMDHSGDVTNDRVVDIVDALMALRHVSGIAPLDAAAVTRCDVAPIVNGYSRPDEVCDLMDVLWILRRTVGLN